jgi:hypothetical protein
MTIYRRLLKDPRLRWNGGFPYDHLAQRLTSSGFQPVGPNSTAQEIKDSFFDLMQSGGADATDRSSWDALRITDTRLVIDFFMYDLPAADLPGIAARLAAAEIPIVYPDFRHLADVEPDFSALPAVTSLPQPEEALPPVSTRDSARSALDIGPLSLDLLQLIGNDDER